VRPDATDSSQVGTGLLGIYCRTVSYAEHHGLCAQETRKSFCCFPAEPGISPLIRAAGSELNSGSGDSRQFCLSIQIGWRKAGNCGQRTVFTDVHLIALRLQILL
jgi:hypothetical protein